VRKREEKKAKRHAAVEEGEGAAGLGKEGGEREDPPLVEGGAPEMVAVAEKDAEREKARGSGRHKTLYRAESHDHTH